MEVAELLKRWRAEPTPPSVKTLYQLSGLAREELQVFKEGWTSLPVERRRQVVKGLVDIVEASFEVDFRGVLRHLLSDEDEEVRAQAIEGLFEDESPWLLQTLASLLTKDTSLLVQAKAASALGRFALLAEMEEIEESLCHEVRESLLAITNNPREDLEVRRHAVESIAYFGDKEVRRIIEEAYQNGFHRMRVSAIFAMGRSLDPYWKNILLTELESPDPELRYEAVRACGELELKASVPLLARLVRDPDREVQELALWALSQIGGPEAQRLLTEAAASEDEVLAEAAAGALSELEWASGIFEIPISGEDEEG